MNVSMAELESKFGCTHEPQVSVILAPDTVLVLFLDGSSILETTRAFTVFESCWNEPAEPTFISFYE